jgi:hypothetical protein
LIADSFYPMTMVPGTVDRYRLSQAIYVASVLRIADLLTGISRTSEELAEATGTQPRELHDLLRALASVELLNEVGPGHFELTTLGDHLRSDFPDSVAAWAAFVGRPYGWGAWAALQHTVHATRRAFRRRH